MHNLKYIIVIIVILLFGLLFLTGCSEKIENESNRKFIGYTYIPVFNGKTIIIVPIPKYRNVDIYEVEE